MPLSTSDAGLNSPPVQIIELLFINIGIREMHRYVKTNAYAHFHL